MEMTGTSVNLPDRHGKTTGWYWVVGLSLPENTLARWKGNSVPNVSFTWRWKCHGTALQLKRWQNLLWILSPLSFPGHPTPWLFTPSCVWYWRQRHLLAYAIKATRCHLLMSVWDTRTVHCLENISNSTYLSLWEKYIVDGFSKSPPKMSVFHILFHNLLILISNKSKSPILSPWNLFFLKQVKTSISGMR